MNQQDHLLSNKTYDFLHKIVTMGLPGFATFYAAMAALWGWANAEAVVGTCAALATFFGVLLTISSASWNNSKDKYDGELSVTGKDPDTGLPHLQLNITKDPSTFAEKRTIRLKSIDNDYFAA